MSEKKMISIWTWSGLILIVYGLLLLGTGLVRLISGAPLETELAHLRADLWWPIVMLVAGGLLLVAGRKEQQA